MNSKGRLYLSKKNIIIGILSQILVCCISLLNRNIFIKFLGIEYLGVSNVLYSLVTIFSVAEIGISEAIAFSLYKPLADDDHEKITEILKLLRKFYFLVSVIIILVGIFFSPFLKNVLKDSINIEHIYIIYFLYILNASLSYVFSYKKILLVADQKKYVESIVSTVLIILMHFLQMILLLLTKSFLLYFVCQIIFNLLTNIVLSVIVNKQYPYLRVEKVGDLPIEDRKVLFKNLFALAIQRINSVIASSIDSIILSVMLGTVIVGKYNNYLMIERYLTQFIIIIFTSLSGSIGNLVATESKEKHYKIFKRIEFLSFISFGITGLCFFTSVDSFINFWLNDPELLLNKSVLFVITLNYYILGVRHSITLFKNAYGLYWQDRFKPLLTVSVNVIFSWLLTKQFGIIGVGLGTAISYLFINGIIEPIVLFKYGFGKKVWTYFVNYFIKLFAFSLLGFVLTDCYTIFSFESSLLCFLVMNIITVSISVIIVLIVFRKNENLLFFLNLVKRTFKIKRSIN